MASNREALTAYELDRVSWLEETLIPDLKESGLDATAEDFEMCIGVIDRLAERVLELEQRVLGDHGLKGE